MKSYVVPRGVKPRLPRGSGSGFTITELLVAVAILSVVLAGVLFAHVFGLSMFQLTKAKLNALDDTRKVISKMTQEIRACRATSIGNVKAGEFEALLDSEKQQGTALMIRPSTNASKFIIYFVNPSDQTFRRTTSTPGSAVIIAESVTNSLIFSARNHSGTVLTNNQNNRVIHATLECYEPRSHLQVADYYKLETSVTRRALE